jgi:hypothetical protein
MSAFKYIVTCWRERDSRVDFLYLLSPAVFPFPVSLMNEMRVE